MSKFLYNDDKEDDDNDYAKAKAIPRIFSENSRAKNILIISCKYYAGTLSKRTNFRLFHSKNVCRR